MITYKNRLPVSLLVGYISAAPHKTGVGIGTPLTNEAHNRAQAVFLCVKYCHIRIMVGRTGPLSGGPGPSLAGSSNPVRLTTLSLEPLGGELSRLTNEGYSSWPTANNAAHKRNVSIPKPKSTAASTAPVHWQHTSRFALIICRQICRCTGYYLSWITLQMICWSCSSLLTPQNEQTKKPHHLKYCLHSACWRGVCLSDIQEVL